jgi:hypothetical protein
MIEKRSLLVTLLGLVCGAALSVWLYHRFKITGFFLFIPVFSLGGSLFTLSNGIFPHTPFRAVTLSAASQS